MVDADGELYYGDCLDILRKRGLNGELYIPDNSVDLIYLDPPFNSNRSYNQIFRNNKGKVPESQEHAFVDTWTWGFKPAAEYEELKRRGDEVVAALVGLEKVLGLTSNMFAYLVMMTTRLVELRKVLKPTGSIYLHCDQTAGHYIKVVMDSVFGVDNFRNEIIWHYGLGGSSPKQWAAKHDNIFMYSKSDDMKFTPFMVPATSQMMKGEMKKMDDVWDIATINNMAKERLGFPTQKPEALLERIIKASSNEGDVVLDPFCGCGTTVAVAHRLKRKWIGIDIAPIALTLIRHRLPPDAKCPPNIGEPTTVEDAVLLAEENPYHFQLWALGLVGARPMRGIKKGRDKGVDGRGFFMTPDGTQTIDYQVKGGQVTSRDVRDLSGVVNREHAAIGVLITLEPPTRDMKSEAAAAGFYKTPYISNEIYHKIQIYTIRELLDSEGKEVVSWPKQFKDVSLPEVKRTGFESKREKNRRLDGSEEE